MDVLSKIGLAGTLGAFALFFGLAATFYQVKSRVLGRVFLVTAVIALVAAVPLVWKLFTTPEPAPVAVIPQTTISQQPVATSVTSPQTIGVKIIGSDGVSFERGQATGYELGGDIEHSQHVNLDDAKFTAPESKEPAREPGVPAPTSQISAPRVVIPPGTPPDQAAAMQDMADRKARGEPMAVFFFRGSSNMTFVNMTMRGVPFPVDVRDSKNINFPGAVFNRNSPAVASPDVPTAATKGP